MKLPIIFREGRPAYATPFWLAFIGWIIGAAIVIIVKTVYYTFVGIQWIWRQGRVAYRRLRR